MVVKDRRGRRRYIAFRVVSESRVSIDDLFRTLGDVSDRSGTRAPKLIEFDGTIGIVRCSNIEKERTLEMLGRLDSIAQKEAKVELLRTSGTLKTLRERYAPRKPGSGR
jgi:RNase P/RNase MRP subunit POP5